MLLIIQNVKSIKSGDHQMTRLPHVGNPQNGAGLLINILFLAILLILGPRRLRPRPARTAADLVFVLAPKVTRNGAGLLINTMFIAILLIFGLPAGPGGAPGSLP